MTFGGVCPEDLGPIRTVSQRELERDLSGQRVERGKGTLLFLPVQGPRTFSCTYLLRGENRLALSLNLARLRHFLLDPGQSRLTLDILPGLVFQARCTYLASPDFSGRSARLEARFETSGVSGELLCQDNFTFNGRHCLRDMGCLFVEKRRTVLPRQALYRYEVAGMPGTVCFHSPDTPGEGQVMGTLYLTGDGQVLSPENRQGKLRRVGEWLLCGRQSLIFDRDPLWTYQAEVTEEVLYTREDWENGAMDLTLVLQPFAKGPVHERTGKVSGAALARVPLDIFPLLPEILHKTPLTLTFENTGTRTVTDLRIYRGQDLLCRLSGEGFALAPEKRLTLRGEEGLAILDGEIRNTSFAGEFPALLPAGEDFSVSGNVPLSLTVRAQAQERRL